MMTKAFSENTVNRRIVSNKNSLWLISLFVFLTMPFTLLGEDIKWETDLKKSLIKAKKEKKEVLIDFSASWCGPCRKMDETTFKDVKLLLEMKKYICVRVDYDENPDLIGRYRIEGIPAVLKLKSNGRELSRSVGYVGATKFTKWLKKKPDEAVLKSIGIFEKLIKKDWNNDQFDHGTVAKKKELINIAFDGYLVKNDSETHTLAKGQLQSFFKKEKKLFISYLDDKRLGVRIFLSNEFRHLKKELTYDPWENAAERKKSIEQIKLFILKK